MPEIFDRFKIPLGLSLIGLILVAGGLISSSYSSKKTVEYPKESIVSNAKNISVDVGGAVVNPGVYQFKADSRVQDAINAAGGFSEEANREHISKYINLAQKIADGMKIYIPKEGETQIPASGLAVVAGVSSSQQVNVNSATQAELEALPGIGPVTAAKIIGARPFGKIEQLLDDKIVSKATYEKLKSLVIAL
jgi:competence protein ComEA